MGRPKLFDDDDLDVLVAIAKEHPLDSLEELANRVEKATGKRASEMTLRRRLREVGFGRIYPSMESAEGQKTGENSRRYGYGARHRDVPTEAAYPHGLSDAEWALVSDIFEDPVRGTPRKYSRRLMVDAMVYAVRGGIPWRMLPHDFPPWHQVYKTFRRWSAQGRFEQMHDRLRDMWRRREGRAPEATAAVIDSQTVKTSTQGGPKGYDAGKKTKGRKRHLMTDTLGLILAVVVHSAAVQDRDGADLVVEAGLQKAPGIEVALVDGAYAGKCKARIESRHPGLTVEVVRHPANRTTGLLTQDTSTPTPKRAFIPLPKRWVVERTNAWNLRPRRLNVDHERTILSATSWIWLAESRRLLRRLTNA